MTNYLIDFFIGLTLVNAMPHIVLGIWKRRMLSGFGFGNAQNILWGVFNFLVSISLFLFRFGWSGLKENPIYVGACFMLFSFAFSGTYWAKRYKNKK